MSHLTEIEAIDHKSLTDADFIALNDFENAMKHEARPEDPPTPLERNIAQVKNLPSHLLIREFWIRDGDAIAAIGYAWWHDTPENRHNAWIDVSVLAAHRRRGIAKQLLGRVIDAVKADSRTMLSFFTTDRLPTGEIFARRLGAEPRQHVHTNRLLVSEVDRALVQRWIDEGPVRAPGYSLVFVDGPFPDDIVEDAVAILDVMNTAPRDGLDWEDFKLTVEQMREIEKAGVAEGTTRWVIFARSEQTGRFVGITEIFWNPAAPQTVQQGDTAVHPDHRGHALGKWMKAAMLDRVMRRWPGVVDVRTGNADSNDAMLGINHALGFKPYIASINWQLPVEGAEVYLNRTT